MRFKGSPEPVRSLCLFPDPAQGFASACNDGFVNIYAEKQCGLRAEIYAG